jgi:acyl-CoA thioesterase
MFQGERLTTIALCVLSTDYEGVGEWAPGPPASGGPTEHPELSIPGTPPPMFGRLETRPAFGSPPFSGGPEAVTGGWLRTRDGDRLTPELVALFTDAWWPAPFSRLEEPSQAPTLELTIHFRARPPEEEYALVHFRSEASIDGFFDESGEVWSADGRLLAQSRQLALLRPWKQPG